MSAPTKGPLVSRRYNSSPDLCARSLALLLQRPRRQKGGPPTAPDDAKEIEHVRAETKSSP